MISTVRALCALLLVVTAGCSSGQASARPCDPAGQDRAIGRFDGMPWSVEVDAGAVRLTTPDVTDELNPEPGQRWLVVSNDGSMTLVYSWLEVGEQLQVTDDRNVLAQCKAGDGGLVTLALPAELGPIDALVLRDGSTVVSIEAAGRGVTAALTEG